MHKKSFKDISLSRLGMGVMRLPMVDADHIDYPKAHEILDRAYAGGVNYYDTAYVYQAGDSERCLGAWLQTIPRDSVYIASKFNIMANPDYEAVFAEELERLQTDHIDFYLLHCLMDNNVDKYIESGAIAFFEEQKRLGKIRYLGFSSHASVETLTRFADHHSWDFAQIQLNYYDWVYGTAAKEYEVLNSRNIPIMVMEPVRGGRLAGLGDEVESMLKAVQPDWTMASWALRFVKGLDGVQVILSGMSNLDQMNDNLSTFSNADGLNEAQNDALMAAVKVFRKQVHAPCTECRYCVPECPMNINIPEALKIYNSFKLSGAWALNKLEKMESEGKISDCVGCGACAARCPQNIEIPALLAEMNEALKK